MDSYIGKVLNDRYEIQSLIGQGSTAVVYKAHCRRLDRTVAIKILNEELSNDEDLLAKFYEESSKVAALSQANIVDIFDINQHQNIHYIVMEYLDGISLKQFIEYKHLLTWNETIYFSIQILKALEYAHAHGVIHHDLKPQNVMILRDGSVKVTDFAIAHFSTLKSTMSRSQLDSTYYLSPEQTSGSEVDTRSDIYSLGIMMYEMLTGKVPYSGTSSVSVAVQHVQGGAIPPRELQPNIPIGLQQITMHAMNSDILYRYNTAYGMKKDLETLQQNPRVGFRYKEPVRQDVLNAPEMQKQPSPAAPTEKPVESAAANAVEEIKPEVPAPTPGEEPDQPAEEEEPAESEATEVPDNDTSEKPAEPAEDPADYVPVSSEFAEPEEKDSVPEEELHNTGIHNIDFPGFAEAGDDETDSFTDESEALSDSDAYDDDYDDDYDYDYEAEEKHHSVVPIIIVILIILILAAAGYFFRNTIMEYAVIIWNKINTLIQNL